MAITFTYTVLAATNDRLCYQLDVLTTAASVGPATDTTLTNTKLVTDSSTNIVTTDTFEGALSDFLTTTAAVSDAAALTGYFGNCSGVVTFVDSALHTTTINPVLILRPVNSGGFIGFDVDFGLSGAQNDTYTYVIDLTFRYLNLSWPPNH